MEGKERWEALPPEKVLESISFGAYDHLLDLGARTGYLTLPAAEKKQGQIYAFDRDPEMLELIETKADKASPANITIVQGEMNELPFSDASVEVVLASLVLHEALSLESVLEEIQRVLLPGGRLMIVELEAFPSTSHKAPRVSLKQMKEAVRRVGLQRIKLFFPTDNFYILTSEKN
ncbi:class I SAM-dependent methyltransferase [Marinococcus luteus]|uniref:class I SAM-dependent methyltransferase n=1 Tax=Marinococcus luteus TaxID=1122204 RepID=UPI0015A438F2|nr:class I SAM-dependent methyltransferase [Marinococcus luteus]